MNWFLAIWKNLRLRRTKDLLFKMSMETENLISACALAIIGYMGKYAAKLRDLELRLAQLKTRLLESLFTTDHWGLKTPLHQPAFTADQVARLKATKRWMALVVGLFIAGEVFLYYLISNNLVPIKDKDLKLVGVLALSLVFALLVLYGFAFSLKTLFTYIEAREKQAQQLIKRRDLQAAFVDLCGGVLVFITVFGFLTYAGISRIHLIEGMASTASTGNAAMDRSMALGNEAAGVMALIFTYCMAIVLGFIKRDLRKSKDAFAAFKAWSRNLAEQERIVRTIARIKAGIQAYISEQKEVYVQLVHDLMRVYGEEFDAANKQLVTDYENERAQPVFEVTSDTLNKYRRIICVDEQLFTAAVDAKAGLRDLRNVVDDATAPVKTSLDRLYQEPLAQPTPATKPTNGAVKPTEMDDAVKALLAN